MGWSPRGPSGRKATPCPACGSMEVVPVIFGLPGPDLVERARRGEVTLGGCMPVPDVDGRCKACGRWRTTGQNDVAR